MPKERSFVDQYIVRPRNPQKFETKVTNYRFARDQKGVLGVVPNGEKDWYLEAQSHAKEVGFELVAVVVLHAWAAAVFGVDEIEFNHHLATVANAKA